MTKITKIFIDSSEDKEIEFCKKLKKRLLNIKGRIEVTLYSEIMEKDDYDGDKWEKATLNLIKTSDIVIPVLSADYLTWLSEEIENKLYEVENSNNKYLLPILYSPSDWGSSKWVVKSKLFPTDGNSISESDSNEVDKVLDELVQIVDSVINNTSQRNKESFNKKNKDKPELVFISHDHDDSDFAELLKLKLEKEGINSWIDSERLKIGQDWREEIDQGIESSIALIVVMTSEARKSEYVTYEWAFAWGKGIKIFPLMLKKTQLHPRLESLQYLDFTNRAIRPWNDLISSIKKISNK